MSGQVIRKTASLCPECLKQIEAEIYEDSGKVFIKKTCPEHGQFTDLYYGSYAMYERVMKWARDGEGIENPHTPFAGCPQSCGLCSLHKSHTALANIVVTNRCDLKCFYCFFYASAMGYVYEPDLPKIREMLRQLRAIKPISTNAIQLTGGEPCLRDDLVDIVKAAKEEGFQHIQLNTNGIRLAHNPELLSRLHSAGVNTLYLSFDGVSPETNPKNHWEIPKILHNCRQTKVGIVLVPTVIKNVNVHELGDIIKFAIKHIDIVRGVNFQPVSLVGRLTKAERDKMRITIPDVIKAIEQQTDGLVRESDWYPVPTVVPISEFVSAFTQRPGYALSAHPVCGMATYLLKDHERFEPITKFIDVDSLMEYLSEKAHQLKSGKQKFLIAAEMLLKLKKFVKRQPKGLNIAKLLFSLLTKGSYSALAEFHQRTLFLGMMHFQDLYNYDIERVKRCCIHYAQPDRTIVPFCAFNVIPEWYRDKIQKQFSLSIEQWQARTGKSLEDDIYVRDVEKLRSDPLYAQTYQK